MKIIEQRRAPNPRRVRIFLAEKGIDVTYEQIDLMQLDHKKPAYTQINRFSQVPSLVLDDGTVICESVAICRYFEGLQPEPTLFGSGALGQAVVEMWNRRVELGLFAAVAYTFRHLHPAMAALEVPQVAAWGEVNRERALQSLRLIDQHLQAQEFLAGDTFSIADITLLVGIDFMKPAKLERPTELFGLQRWYEHVNARSSARA